MPGPEQVPSATGAASGGQAQAPTQLRLLEAGQEQILLATDTIQGLLAEMREPLANGTLEAQGAILQSAVDRLVANRRSAQLYCQFPCFALYHVAPGRFLMEDST